VQLNKKHSRMSIHMTPRNSTARLVLVHCPNSHGYRTYWQEHGVNFVMYLAFSNRPAVGDTKHKESYILTVCVRLKQSLSICTDYAQRSHTSTKVYWLELDMHLEGSKNDQVHQVLPWFSSVLE
jgi:hypothetical protein